MTVTVKVTKIVKILKIKSKVINRKKQEAKTGFSFCKEFMLLVHTGSLRSKLMI